MRNFGFDRGIAELARRQHGVVSLAQVKEAGGSRTMVGDRVATGSWVRLAPTVWALASFPSTWRRQYKAAELSVRGSAIADRAGALVHGFEGFRVVRPALVVPYTANPRSEIADLRRSVPVPTVMVDGIRVTSIAQTLFDLLSSCELWAVERAMDGALLDKRVTTEQLVDRLEAFRASRRSHLRTWAGLLAERRADGWRPPESELEALLATILARLPPEVDVRTQSRLPWWRPAEGRVDVLLPSWRVIVEADGRRWHARVADFERDRWRDNVAHSNGYRVLRFTYTHLAQRPDEVLDLLLSAGSYSVIRRTG